VTVSVPAALLLAFASIGPKALYLLLIWLASAAAAGWLSERKGYGERLGLTFGLLLSAVGLLVVLLLPGRPNSVWKLEGPLPRRTRRPSRPPAGARPHGDPADPA
jgi:hypothetical protein